MFSIIRFIFKLFFKILFKPVLNLFIKKYHNKSPKRKYNNIYKSIPKINIDSLITAPVKKVTDGDGVIVLINEKEVTLRLFAIDCPEYDQPWGDTAKAGLIKLIGGKTIFLEIHGLDPFERMLSTIYVKDENKLINVNERMVILGHAWVYKKYYGSLPWNRKSQLDRLFWIAQKKKNGLWKQKNPIPPWDWRKKDSA